MRRVFACLIALAVVAAGWAISSEDSASAASWRRCRRSQRTGWTPYRGPKRVRTYRTSRVTRYRPRRRYYVRQRPVRRTYTRRYTYRAPATTYRYVVRGSTDVTPRTVTRSAPVASSAALAAAPTIVTPVPAPAPRVVPTPAPVWRPAPTPAPSTTYVIQGTIAPSCTNFT